MLELIISLFFKKAPLIQESDCCGSLQKSCPLATFLFVFPGSSQETQVCFPSFSRFPSPQARTLNSKHCTRNYIFKGAHAELSNQKPILFIWETKHLCPWSPGSDAFHTCYFTTCKWALLKDNLEKMSYFCTSTLAASWPIMCSSKPHCKLSPC